jgi:hypothetical protein
MELDLQTLAQIIFQAKKSGGARNSSIERPCLHFLSIWGFLLIIVRYHAG